MKLALSYFVSVVLVAIVIGFMNNPIIAFVFFMATNIVVAIVTAVFVIFVPQRK